MRTTPQRRSYHLEEDGGGEENTDMISQERIAKLRIDQWTVGSSNMRSIK